LQNHSEALTHWAKVTAILLIDDFSFPFDGYRSPVEPFDVRLSFDVLVEPRVVVDEIADIQALFAANKPLALTPADPGPAAIAALVDGFLGLAAPEANELGELFLPEIGGFVPAPAVSLTFSPLDWMSSVAVDINQADYFF
jgi:hypothetical protein